MPAPPVSVVIATRDRPELVRRALASVRDQDLAGVVETILVFDQSEPDHSLASSDEARPVVVTANGRTPGLTGSRNTGILAAGGDLVAFLDDDDEWVPTKLSRQLAVLEREPQTDVVVSGITVVYEGKETDRPAPERITFADLTRRRLTEAHSSTFVFRREALLDRIGLVTETLPGDFCEDWELLLRASRIADLRAVPEPLARIHWHAGSYYADRWTTIDRALARMVELHPELARDRRGHARLLGQRAFAQAATGEREARRTAWAAIRRWPGEPRGYLAMAAALRIVRPERIRAALHRAGRGF